MVGRLKQKAKVAAESWVVFCLSIFILIFSIYINFFASPAPYKNVELVSTEVYGNEYHLIANFDKTDCVFVRLTAIGYAAGATEFLNYKNAVDLGYDYDRDAGKQTLNIIIDLQRDFYEWVEIRTRHKCGEELVDKIFLHLDEVP